MMQNIFVTCGFLLILAIATASGETCGSDSGPNNATAKPIGDYSWNMYQKYVAKKANQNFVFSPASLVLALALIELGSAGQTQQQLKTVLVSSENQSPVESYYHSLTSQLTINQGNATLRVANGIWVANDKPLKPQYTSQVRSCYGARIESVDFQTQSEAVRVQINSWVSDITNQKIPNLIGSGLLTAQTTNVLVNALYFKAPWNEKYLTQNKNFYPIGQSQPKQTKFMLDTDDYWFNENEDAQILGIPYKDAPIIMYFVKAKAANTGIESIESKLNADVLRTLARGATRRKVQFEIPAFTIRTKDDRMGDILKELGLARMFTVDAEFPRMANASFKVDKVIHEAFIKVNENGTEAAAATVIAMAGSSFPQGPTPPPPIPFIADRPFMFCLVHNPTRTNLFLGKVNDAKEEE